MLASKWRFLFRADAVSSSLVSVLDDDCVVYGLALALCLPRLRAVKKKDESVQMLSFALQASAHVGSHPPPSPRLWQWTWMLDICFITAEKGRSRVKERKRRSVLQSARADGDGMRRPPGHWGPPHAGIPACRLGIRQTSQDEFHG